MEFEKPPSTSSAEAKNDNAAAAPPTRTPSPDRVKCAICLGDLINKSYSDRCIHQFCFGCLLEWSKVKPECPLCKSVFKAIFHNIRSNADYDEYVVPTPINPPSLSIRVTSGTDRSPELLITRGNHDYTLPIAFPNLPTYSSYHLRSASALMRTGMEQRLRDRDRILRFQLHSPFGMTSRNEIDVTLHGIHSAFHENPFNTEQPEFFGGALDLANRGSSSQQASNFSGYQTRRRRYDRGQWVRPFESTLVPGTVFFPSVEYFQRHPSAMRRISPWLHRELTVLMSLSNSRTQMAFTYEMVISLLLRYDIRSVEFRDLVRPYLGTKSRQFQHEFYYFVLSGMRVDEYDRIAQYPATQATSSIAGGTRTELNPLHVEPTIVTLDSDNEQQDDDLEIVINDEDFNALPSTASRERTERRSRSRRNRINRNQDRVSPLHHLLDFDVDVDMPDAVDNFDLENALNEIDNEVARLRSSTHRRSTSTGSIRDPEMPVLERQSDFLSNSNDSMLHPDVSYTLNRLLNDDEMERPPRNDRHSPYPLLSPTTSSSSYMPPSLMSFQYENRPLSSPDFPILTLRENRERRNQQQQSIDLTDNDPRWRSTVSASMERPSCIHSTGSSSSVQIRIFPPAMDLSSSHGLNLTRSNTVIQRSPGLDQSSNANNEVGECEFLGVHPVIKKPPLAVITLSSEEEEEEERTMIKFPIIPKHKTIESTGINIFQPEPIPSTSTQFSSTSIPPKRRHKLPPIEMDNFEAALSSLPSENLVDRLNLSRSNIYNLSTSTKRPYRSKSSKAETSKTKKAPKDSVKMAPLEKKSYNIRRYLSVNSVTVATSYKPDADAESPGNSSDINLFSDTDESDDFSGNRNKSKKLKKKKSKKSKKPAKSIKEKPEKPKIKLSISRTLSSSKLPTVSSTADLDIVGSSSSKNKSWTCPTKTKLKSTVVKVQKPKPLIKKYKSKAIISSSESDEETVVGSPPVKRLRSIITTPSTAASSSTTTATGSGSSSRSNFTPNSALDLTTANSVNATPSSYLLESTPTSNLKLKITKKLSRRWESDDEDNVQNSDNQGEGASDASCDGSLLSVGYDGKVSNTDSSDSEYNSYKTFKKQRMQLDDN